MKIAFTSDVHLEFGPILLENTEHAEVLILAGDILVAKDIATFPDPFGITIPLPKYDRAVQFFKQVHKEFPKTLMIMGNHEHYNGDFHLSRSTIQRFLEHIGVADKVLLVDKEVVQVADKRFYLGTMWTNFNKRNPIAMNVVQNSLNDYACVAYSGNGSVDYLRPEHTYQDHLAYMEGLADKLETAEELIVVSHHTPSIISVHPKYADQFMVNHGYYSDLSEFILDNTSKIPLWIHGHTHYRFDYKIGDTRIVSNPRGYHGYEVDFERQFKLKFLDI